MPTPGGEQFSTVTVRITPKGAMKIADAMGADRGLVADILEPDQLLPAEPPSNGEAAA